MAGDITPGSPDLTQGAGLAAAFHRGILEATGDIIGWMDADMTMPPEVMNNLIAQLDQHHVAIGSRYVEGGSDNRNWLRVSASRAINWLARVVLGGHVRDYDSGFVAIRREAFDYITLIPDGLWRLFYRIYLRRIALWIEGQRSGLCLSRP